MPDTMTSAQRSECMSRIRSKNTKPEISVRKELWRRGYRYRLHVAKLPGKPDIVLGKYRTVLFINGCFWHGHDGCKKYVEPKSNVEFWKEKIHNNKRRDAHNINRLEGLAWNVITIWECELEKDSFAKTLYRIEGEIKANAVKWAEYKAERRRNRQFALEQSRIRRAIQKNCEEEIEEIFHIPSNVKRMARTETEALI